MDTLVNIVIQFFLVASLQVQGTFITSDNLSNLYVVTANNSLVKYDSTGKQLFTYNTLKYGQLKFVDATNPMKLLLYYPDFTTLVLLDNTMSELSTMNLKQAGIIQPLSVCLSMDNNIWIYDAQEFKLKKLDQNLNVLAEGSDLLATAHELAEPDMLLERDNFIFLNDPAKGIFVFDNYGAYSHLLPIKGLKDLQVFNKKIYYLKENSIQSYDLQTLQTKTISLPGSSQVLQSRIERDRLFLLKEKKVTLYRY